jgi:hypothetical protein
MSKDGKQAVTDRTPAEAGAGRFHQGNGNPESAPKQKLFASGEASTIKSCGGCNSSW